MAERKHRTFGWIQNPGSLDTLRNVVEIFSKDTQGYDSLTKYKLPIILHNEMMSRDNYDLFMEYLNAEDIVLPYDIAKGKGVKSNEKRSMAKCTGIVQAILDAQKTITIKNFENNEVEIKKPYCDDWTTDGYLRWAISTGLLYYDAVTDCCSISELGKELVKSEQYSLDEADVFTRALLSYPPVYRVLDILSDHKAYTKFEIGEKLGFKGELGFTSIPQAVYVYDYCNANTASEKSEIRSNLEGDADKYARMIANWLVKMGWVKASKKKVTENYYGAIHSINMNAWEITREGEKAIIRSNGKSSNAKIPKIVKFEMLASKISNCDYVRLRRAYILQVLRNSSTLENIKLKLKTNVLDENIETIKDDIENFSNIGLRIEFKNNKYKLLDNIVGLEIPINNSEVSKNEITTLKEHVRSKLEKVNHRYLVLIDLAYSDASSRNKKNLDAKNFEIETANLFAKELGFKAERLGDSNKPDVLVEFGKYGTIIDNKSYKDGFTLSANLRDEMARYIEQNQLRKAGVPANEWWKWFNEKAEIFTYLFITSCIRGKFKSQLEYIYNIRQIYGGGINVVNLLYLADKIKSDKISKEEFFALMKNDEICI